MKKIIATLAVAAAAAFGASSASADYWCGTPHGTVVASDNLPCWLGRDIVDRAYDVYGYNEVSFAVDGQFVYCFKNYSGGWYFLCEPHPNGGYVYWYI